LMYGNALVIRCRPTGASYKGTDDAPPLGASP
jgi:hypothetical protein